MAQISKEKAAKRKAAFREAALHYMENNEDGGVEMAMKMLEKALFYERLEVAAHASAGVAELETVSPKKSF